MCDGARPSLGESCRLKADGDGETGGIDCCVSSFSLSLSIFLPAAVREASYRMTSDFPARMNQE